MTPSVVEGGLWFVVNVLAKEADRNNHEELRGTSAI
jgi:hypothetical protein